MRPRASGVTLEVLGGVLGLAALLAGCSTGSPTQKAASCAPACGPGLACTAGRCGPIACSSNSACPAGLTCLGGFCASQACAPACGAGQVCLDQVCVSSGADAGALTCAPPYQLCASASGDGYCAATLSDSSNCGGCGGVCAPGEVCNGAGVCGLVCAAGETVCDNRCVSLATDRGNCGACGVACGAGQVCSTGGCAATCAAPEVSCGAACADTGVDPANCGGCGTVCQAGQLCVSSSCTVGCGGALVVCDGVCTDSQFDDANCGACGVGCGAGRRCVQGTCDACGNPGALCCAGGGCTGGASCLGEVCAAPDAGGFSTLSLLAGQLGGAGNLDGVGPLARFYMPGGVVSDDGGNLYVSDTDNGEIRRIVIATGQVTTVAGDSALHGNAAPFNTPEGLVPDGAGNLYVVDSDNDVLRKVVIATGAVTTLAGTAGVAGSADGTGAAASFDGPWGLAYDGTANLYLTDHATCTVRQIAVATGTVTTLAGSAGVCGAADGTGAAASFNGPLGIVYDGAGNLYVADSFNDTLRKLVVATGAVTTVAGTAGVTGHADGAGAAASFDQPSGLTWDGVANLYLTDTLSCLVRQVVAATAVVKTLAGNPACGNADGTGAAAGFLFPAGVTYGAGSLFVADAFNSDIRQVALATAAVTTLAGEADHGGTADGTGAAAQFFGPEGLAADDGGNLYVADGASTLRRIAVATGAVTTLAGDPDVMGNADGIGADAGFSSPSGLAWDGLGHLFVADTVNQEIREVDLATAAVTTLAGNGLTGSDDGVGAAARFDYPQGLAYGGAGLLYVSDSINDTLRQIDVATGTVTTLAGAVGDVGSADGIAGAARFNYPYGLACDGLGNLYVTDYSDQTIRQVVLATASVTTLAGLAGTAGTADGIGAAARFNSPAGLTSDGEGNLYLADEGNQTVRKIDVATGTVTTVLGTAGQAGALLGPAPGVLNLPTFLVFGPGATALYLSDRRENSILVAQ